MDAQPKQRRGFEVDGLDTRPAFCSIMFPENSVRLRIPRAFKKHIQNEQADKATLKTRSGSWKVTRLEHEGDVYLTHGWEQFVKHHCLVDLEYLVFKYNGNLCFDVDIYERTGWKRICGKSVPSFTSLKPFFEHKIKKYNVGSKCTLVIPKHFASNHLDVQYPIHVTLRNSDKMSWRISVIRRGPQPIMSAGWRKFAEGNALKIGDTCIFELVEQNMMQVQIVRST